MRIRALLPVLATALLASLASPMASAVAGTVVTTTNGSLTMVSDEGDLLGGGVSRTILPGTGSFEVHSSTHASAPERIDVKASGGDLANREYGFAFEAPFGERLVPGTYEGARSDFRAEHQPLLGIWSPQTRGCSGGGRFTVLDIGHDGSTLSRLHLLYEFRCGGGDAALFGELRVGMPEDPPGLVSTPRQVAWPLSYTDVPARTVTVNLTNSGAEEMTVGVPEITDDASSSFTVGSGSCGSSLGRFQTCQLRVDLVPSQAGPLDAVLHVPDPSGGQPLTVSLSGSGDARTTSWQTLSEPDAPLMNGRSLDLGPSAVVDVQGSASSARYTVRDEGVEVGLYISPGRGDTLQAGRTYRATHGVGSELDGPGMLLVRDVDACEAGDGGFTVHELVLGADRLEQLSLTFELSCRQDSGAPSGLITGSLTYHADSGAQPVPALPGPPPSFNDIGGDPHEGNILIVAQDRIVGGYADGTYRPRLAVTRGQMATFLVKALELPPAPSAGFTDTAGHTHAASIDAVADLGIAGGYSDGSYRPDAPVTRGQMATFLVRALELPPAPSAGFTDTAGDPHEAAIDTVADWGIAGGYSDGSYRPRNSVTRGQLATFLVRALYS